jgi:hypothetical protein
MHFSTLTPRSSLHQAPGIEIRNYALPITVKGLVASIFFAFFNVFLVIPFPLVRFTLSGIVAAVCNGAAKLRCHTQSFKPLCFLEIGVKPNAWATEGRASGVEIVTVC